MMDKPLSAERMLELSEFLHQYQVLIDEHGFLLSVTEDGKIVVIEKPRKLRVEMELADQVITYNTDVEE